MNTYNAYWKNQQVEVKAETTISAQELALPLFQANTRKRVKRYDITVVLAAKGGRTIRHQPQELCP